MKLEGTEFQVKVWKYLRTIPRGKVITYKQLAKAIKMTKAVRAVANALSLLDSNSANAVSYIAFFSDIFYLLSFYRSKKFTTYIIIVILMII